MFLDLGSPVSAEIAAGTRASTGSCSTPSTARSAPRRCSVSCRPSRARGTAAFVRVPSPRSELAGLRRWTPAPPGSWCRARRRVEDVLAALSATRYARDARRRARRARRELRPRRRLRPERRRAPRAADPDRDACPPLGGRATPDRRVRRRRRPVPRTGRPRPAARPRRRGRSTTREILAGRRAAIAARGGRRRDRGRAASTSSDPDHAALYRAARLLASILRCSASSRSTAPPSRDAALEHARLASSPSCRPHAAPGRRRVIGRPPHASHEHAERGRPQLTYAAPSAPLAVVARTARRSPRGGAGSTASRAATSWRVELRHLLAVEQRHDVVGGDRAALDDRPTAPSPGARRTSARLASMCALHVGERARRGPAGTAARRAPPPRPASRGTRRPGPASSRSRSTARRGRAGGRRRSAGAARAGAGRRATGAWPGVSTTVHGPRSVSTTDAGDEVAVGLDDAARCPLPRRARASAHSAQRLDRHAALARDLQAPRAAPPRGPRRCAHVRVVGMHPQLAAAGVDDARRLAVVVGVRVRADEQPDVGPGAGRPAPSRARAAPASPARACRSRTARRRRRPPPPRRCSAARPATAAAGAGARRPAGRARRARARVVRRWTHGRRHDVERPVVTADDR